MKMLILNFLGATYNLYCKTNHKYVILKSNTQAFYGVDNVIDQRFEVDTTMFCGLAQRIDYGNLLRPYRKRMSVDRYTER